MLIMVPILNISGFDILPFQNCNVNYWGGKIQEWDNISDELHAYAICRYSMQ